MNTDDLSLASRKFFERTKTKLIVSILLGAGCIVLLGLCSVAGGESASSSNLYQASNDDHVKSANYSLQSGYGFASFVFILGFMILFIAAIYASPILCGSLNEKKMIRTPTELEGSFAASVPELSRPALNSAPTSPAPPVNINKNISLA